MALAWKPHLKRLIGEPVLHTGPVGLAQLHPDWTFRRSRPTIGATLGRWRVRNTHAEPPAWHALRAVSPRGAWNAYFVYLPDGHLTAAHRYTLAALRATRSAGLLVVCATPAPADVPRELHGLADALYWKALSGFDFSAFAIALHEVARHSPGAALLTMNDSVFGPFVPLDQVRAQMRWDLTGFTASGAGQNHVQSYAFYLLTVDATVATALEPVLPRRWALDDYQAVLLRQELRMAAVASRTMSVGALWYADPQRCADPSLHAALPLVRDGFPFLKRALLGKHAGIYPQQEILEVLEALGHPTP